jgi:hypothetical protein
MFALMNNRGSQIGLYDTKEEAQKVADAFNRRGLDVFAWVVDAPKDAEHEDMPGRGFVYG